ncbi:hypothetical protein SLA2020_453260 [Shorea laevis]
MDSNSLELKVSYCKDLRAFNFFQKLSAYALVSIVSDDPNKKLERNQQQRTPADGEGDGNPEWNYEMRFDLKEVSFQDCEHLFLQFDLRHQGVMFGDKTIGEVRVAFKDLTQQSNLGVLRFVSYQVRASDGKPNGVLSFSYKVTGTTSASSSSPHDDHEIHYPTLEVLQNDLSEERTGTGTATENSNLSLRHNIYKGIRPITLITIPQQMPTIHHRHRHRHRCPLPCFTNCHRHRRRRRLPCCMERVATLLVRISTHGHPRCTNWRPRRLSTVA